MEYQYEVSVIILTYYHEEYIEQALKSVLNQNVDFSYEILVSDDSSKDQTLNIVKNIKAEFPDITIEVHTYEKNVGTTQNLYDAFLRTRGKYITLLSGDDYYCNYNKLALQKKYLDSNIGCFAVAITTESVYRDGELTGIMCPDIEFRGKDFSQFDFANGKNYPIHGIMFRNYFYNNEFCNKIHIFVEFNKYIEDLSLCLLFFEFGKVHVLSDICYRITVRRQDDTNQHNFNSIVNEMDIHTMTIDLIMKLQQHFGKKIDMSGRLADPCFFLIVLVFKTGKFNYLKHLRDVPKKCILIGCRNWIHRKIGA